MYPPLNSVGYVGTTSEMILLQGIYIRFNVDTCISQYIILGYTNRDLYTSLILFNGPYLHWDFVTLHYEGV